ncbi:MAG: peptidoglycan-binding domain-containing protein [Candidatus Pacebacteria bacterium]|nr:peptidoglycan-binding domain-containing protein [Candidatus Paceibacterota bacterium]
MNEIKYQITQLIFLILLGLGAYWALTHLDNGVSYTSEKLVQQQDLTEQNDIEDQEIDLFPEVEIGERSETPTEETESTPSESETSSQPSQQQQSSSHPELVSALEKLISDNIYMKVGSRGTRVGTVQKYLALYFSDKNVSVDNDYGNGTRDLVREFQTKEGLDADGQAGPSTYQKMIDLLKKNS